MSRAAVITGLAAEAKALKSSLPSDRPAFAAFIACAGADSGRAARLATQYLESGVTGLVSFGVCGGLDPELGAGQIVLPTSVESGLGLRYGVDLTWHQRLREAAEAADLTVEEGPLLGSEKPLRTLQDKRRPFEEKGLRVVDMESHGVARIAADAGVPFVAVRVVADHAQRGVPGLTDGLIDESGEPRRGRAALRLMAQPWQIPAVMALRRDFDTALSGLELLALILGELLFQVDGEAPR